MKRSAEQFIGGNVSTYVYLSGVFFLLVFGYSYSIRYVDYGITWLLFSAFVLILFLLFVTINHLFVKNDIPHRKLFVIESLMFITLIVQIINAAVLKPNMLS